MGIAFLLACAIGDPATDITIGMGMLQKSLVINDWIVMGMEVLVTVYLVEVGKNVLRKNSLFFIKTSVNTLVFLLYINNQNLNWTSY